MGARAKALAAWVRGEALLCCAAVAAGVSMFFVPPSVAYAAYIDLRVLILLFCLMAVVAGFQACGLFAVLAQRLLAGRKNLRLLLLLLVLLPFFSAMLVTNDVALITFVPFTILILSLIDRQRYLIPAVVLQTLAANLGSMATPVGNPQNLFLYAKYALQMGPFLRAVLPLLGISLLGLCLACVCVPGEVLQVHFAQRERLTAPRKLAAYGALFGLCLLSVFHLLPEAALFLIVIAGVLVCDWRLLGRVDYSLLATFVCFFIFVGNLGQIGAVREFLARMLSGGAMLPAVAASQVISNVPAAVLLANFTQDWRGLVMGTNIGGLGTPIASMASLISLKIYLRSPQARPARYVAWFLAANAVGLAVLLGAGLLLS
ncbi:MAG: SLC13 family permease [Christensenellales bacterium]|jgi:Na+/H+ antiporter NhaD/arsenite permease-like protein